MRADDKFVLLGIPSSAGAWRAGQEKAPSRLREQGIADRIRAEGLELRDVGDAPTVRYSPDDQNPKRRNIHLVRAVGLDAAKRLDAAMAGDEVPLILGGGCTITLGVLAALTLRFDDLGLVYVDGDLDFNTPETTPSGTFDGMGLAHIVGMGAPELSRIGSRFPLVPQERTAVFGFNPDAGWIDPYEINTLNDSAIARFSSRQVREDPLAAAREAIDRIQRVADRFLIHFDVDVMDVGEFPATDAQHEDGLCADDVAVALGEFAKNPRCVGLVVTEYNPDLDPTGACARKLIDIVGSALADLPA
jgi:arginase